MWSFLRLEKRQLRESIVEIYKIIHGVEKGLVVFGHNTRTVQQNRLGGVL